MQLMVAEQSATGERVPLAMIPIICSALRAIAVGPWRAFRDRLENARVYSSKRPCRGGRRQRHCLNESSIRTEPFSRRSCTSRVELLPRALWAALILALIPSLVLAQRAQVEQFVRAEMQQERIPGLAFAVYGASGTLLSGAHGFANVELSVAASTRTLFKSGSIAKEFVAVTTLMLAEESRLSIDDPVRKYLTDAPSS